MSPPGAERPARRPAAQSNPRQKVLAELHRTPALEHLHMIERLADEGAAILARGMLGMGWKLDDDLAAALVEMLESIGRRAGLIGRLL